MKFAKTVQKIVQDVKDDIESQGLEHYEACYHSTLYLAEFSSDPAEEVAEFMLAVLKADPYMDAWVAAVLGELYQQKEQYKLNQEWFDKILEHEELGIF